VSCFSQATRSIRSACSISLPDAGKRFMSLQIINEDHYVPFVAYDRAISMSSPESRCLF
jgi:hypothetical protein